MSQPVLRQLPLQRCPEPQHPELRPEHRGLDEDYDACDLDNRSRRSSADGQVIIPSFHRPGIIRYDPKNGVNDCEPTRLAGPIRR